MLSVLLVNIIFWSDSRHVNKAMATRPAQEKGDINELIFCTDKDNFDVLYKKFEQTHPDSNFLKLYGWNGSEAKPTNYSNAFINGILKTTMHAGEYTHMTSALRCEIKIIL